MPRTTIACAVAGALFGGHSAPAQDQRTGPPPGPDDVRRELERLRERVDTLEGQHQSDQERIEALEEELRRRPARPAPSPLEAERAAQTRKLIEGVIRSTFIVDVDSSGQGKIAIAQYNVKAAGHVDRLRRELAV